MITKIINAKIVSSTATLNGSILIQDEKIIKIGQCDNDFADITYDANGRYVFPGFIDAHTHFQMNSAVGTTADNFTSGSRAAIKGGTTMFINFADQENDESLHDCFNNAMSLAKGNCACDYKFHISICNWNDSVKKELYNMKALGVSSFKAYLAYDCMLSDQALYELLGVMKDIGGILGVHCENGSIITSRTASLLQSGCTTPKYHPISRPPYVEAEAISRFLYMAGIVDVPVNIVHLSSEAGLNEIRKSRYSGQKVYVETCPQYLLLDDSKYTDNFESAKYVCSPPLRSKKDTSALWNSLCNKEIQTISTDHCSFNFKSQKSAGINDFSKIPNGMPGCENRPSLIYTYGVKTGRITVNDMCALLSENIAKIFGVFPQKGIIAPGSDADLVIWEDCDDIISASTSMQNVDYNPYEGFKISGRPLSVFLRGHKVSPSELNGKYISSL